MLLPRLALLIDLPPVVSRVAFRLAMVRCHSKQTSEERKPVPYQILHAPAAARRRSPPCCALRHHHGRPVVGRVAGVKPEPVRDLDWEPKRARELGEAALDLWEELLARLRDLPISRYEGVGPVRDRVALPVPDDPMAPDDLVAHLQEVVLERSMYPGHPGFMAYISGAGTVPGAAADLVAAAVNQNLGGWRLSPAASELEHHLTRWFAAEFGLPQTAGGLLVSGGA